VGKLTKPQCLAKALGFFLGASYPIGTFNFAKIQYGVLKRLEET
jgi:hypothetical protein